ncbi:DMT family transporter [Pedobacter immunditicola]|uniref:DMT family transporter n=1 Tax=Pedobacter immunditicola TaxID=3133440 RepID=UPI00309CFD17
MIPLYILPIRLSDFPPNYTLFLRFLLAALIILGYLIFKKESLKINLKETLILFILGLCYALSTEFLLLGYEMLTPGIASTILFIFPVIVATIMVLFFKERISRMAILSIGISTTGVLILGIQDSIYQFNISGLLICLLSALFYALYMIIVNKSQIKVSGFKLTFYSLLFSSCYYLAKMTIVEETFLIPNPSIMLNLVMLSLVSTVLSIITLVYAIKYIGSTSTSVMGALEPIVAISVSVLFFGEHLTVSLISGVALILAGVIMNITSDALMTKKTFN